MTIKQQLEDAVIIGKPALAALDATLGVADPTFHFGDSHKLRFDIAIVITEVAHRSM